MASEILDCVIVGAGPAGLTAAVYLARYRCRIALLDDGRSRARLIPASRNIPGFPQGISGADLLEKMAEHAARYGVTVQAAHVESVQRRDGCFEVHSDSGRMQARHVLLATGLADRQPPMPYLRRAIEEGHVRLCPVCDGYEVIDKHVGVLGTRQRAVEKALFLRPYTDRLVVFLPEGEALNDQQRKRLEAEGIAWKDAAVTDVRLTDDDVTVITADGAATAVEILYPALGCDVRSDLATVLGARCTKQGFLVVDAHQQTTVPGMYGCGDVVNELNQICVATGHAGIAATAIYNELRERRQKDKA